MVGVLAFGIARPDTKSAVKYMNVFYDRATAKRVVVLVLNGAEMNS